MRVIILTFFLCLTACGVSQKDSNHKHSETWVGESKTLFFKMPQNPNGETQILKVDESVCFIILDNSSYEIFDCENMKNQSGTYSLADGGIYLCPNGINCEHFINGAE